MPPPIILRSRRARAIASRPPTSADPTGAPSPFRREAGRGARVPEPRAIEVEREPERARPRGDLHDLPLREDTPAPPIVRVLERDERGAGQPVGDRSHRRFDLRDAERPAAPRLGELHPRPGRAAARLVLLAVRALADDHFVAAPTVQEQRELVRHRARGYEERGLLAEERRRLRLERLRARVLAVDVVADLRLGHHAAHGGRGPRDGVGAEIDAARGCHERARIAERATLDSARGAR
jgi:hypothetical protein